MTGLQQSIDVSTHQDMKKLDFEKDVNKSACLAEKRLQFGNR